MSTNALTIIEKARGNGALVFVGQGISEVVPLFKTDATALRVTQADFHNVQGKFVARKELCDRIGDAAGVSFIAEHCGVKTETRDDDLGRRTIFVGFAQGKTRLPDGSWRESSVNEYEFDPYLRAEMEAGDKAKKKLEYMKAGRARASTGARLRIIRELTGMPTAFEAAQIPAGGTELIFSRIVQNTDYILSTKEGRMMAIAAATGVAAQIYGQRQEPEHQEHAQFETRPAEDASHGIAPAERDPFAPDDEPTLSPNEARAYEIRKALVDWANVEDKAVAAAAERILGRDEKDIKVLEPSLELIICMASGKLRAEGYKACKDALEKTPRDPIVLADIASKAMGAKRLRESTAAAKAS